MGREMIPTASYVLSGLYILANEILLTIAETTVGAATPPATDPPTTPEPSRSFDGWSFFGGIIFASCCLVGGFVVYRYFIRKKTTGDNYGVF